MYRNIEYSPGVDSNNDSWAALVHGWVFGRGGRVGVRNRTERLAVVFGMVKEQSSGCAQGATALTMGRTIEYGPVINRNKFCGPALQHTDGCSGGG